MWCTCNVFPTANYYDAVDPCATQSSAGTAPVSRLWYYDNAITVETPKGWDVVFCVFVCSILLVGDPPISLALYPNTFKCVAIHGCDHPLTPYLPHPLPPSPLTSLTPYLPHPLPPSPLTSLTPYLPHPLPPSPLTSLTPYLPHPLPPSPLTSLTPYLPHPLPPSPLTSLTPCLPHPLPPSPLTLFFVPLSLVTSADGDQPPNSKTRVASTLDWIKVELFEFRIVIPIVSP